MLLTPLITNHPTLRLKPGRWTVGSAATCSYRVIGPGVQPRHALLLCGGQSVVLKAWDAQTWRNEQPVVGEVTLQAGDLIRLGSVELQFEPERIAPELPPPIPTEQPAAATELDDEVRLCEQIQQLRHELSPHLQQRTTVQPANADDRTPQTRATPLTVELQALRSKATELEQSLEAARNAVATAQAELQAARDEAQRIADERAARDVAAEADRHAQQAAFLAERQIQAARESQLQRSIDDLRTEFEQRHTAWSREQTWFAEETARLVEIVARLEADAAKRERDTAPRAEQRLAEHQRLEQWQSELEVQRQSSQTQMADLQSRRQTLDRELADVWQTRSEQTREKQVLEHSWNWLESERKKLVEDQENTARLHTSWQTEREQWAVARQAELDQLAQARADVESHQSEVQGFLADKQSCLEQQEREAAELQSARAELQSEQVKLSEERQRWEALEQDFASRRGELEQLERRLDEDRQALIAERSALELEFRSSQSQQPALGASTPGENDLQSGYAVVGKSTAAKPPAESLDELAQSPDVESCVPFGGEESGSAFADPWSAGVDLTDPYRANVASVSNFATSARIVIPSASPPSDELPPPLPTFTEPGETTNRIAWSRPLSEATSLSQLCSRDSTSIQNSGARLSDFVVAAESIQPNPPADSAEFRAAVEAETRALRERLADMFNMPDLRKLPERDGATLTSPDGASSGTPLAFDRRSSAGQPASVSPETSGDASQNPAEPEDDSVSQYMRHLLTRSRSLANVPRESAQLAAAGQLSATNLTDRRLPSSSAPRASDEGDPLASVVSTNGDVEGEALPLPNAPAQSQNKLALREATEKMRDVANQQTRDNLKTHGWKTIRASMHTKCGLALFSFVVSMGLFYLGYRYKPEFIVLGGCAACLGVLTWIDLFLAVRETRQIAAQVGKMKKPAGIDEKP